MPSDRPPAAWLLMAAGEDREHGGNAGYDDQADVYYSWDSTVSNATNIRAGDLVAIWDKRRLLGVSVIEEVETTLDTKPLFRCPNPMCGRAGIKPRKTKAPRYRCQSCRKDFDEPATEIIPVTTYRSRHDAAWSALEGVLSGQELRALCKSPKSQLSMRALDWSAFREAVERKGETRAISRVVGRAPDLQYPGLSDLPVEYAQGHTLATVCVRRGQAKFRERLLQVQGRQCAFTGSAPARVLEAGHLYSYAKLGEHHEHGGLLLRRDVHRLFDDGSLAVDPDTLKVDVSGDLEKYVQYARLHDERLAVRLRDPQVEWLGRHWAEHRGGKSTATR